TLTIDRVTSDIAKAETFADLSAGRRARSWLRFAHTGEFYGLAGQTIAGIVSGGSVVLVYTGLALACRRFMSWIRRRNQTAVEQARAA
ncbi:MAG: PepSY domain-containing protein, partial [Acidobacteriota bacterium]|nr:PepSY domain-containing protein [Acidobacteriota bacterium]